MSSLAIVFFIAFALLLAAILIVSSVRTGREDDREIADADGRAEQARREAAEARALRVRLIDSDLELADALTVRRLPEDLPERELERTQRFKRAGAPARLPPAGPRART